MILQLNLIIKFNSCDNYRLNSIIEFNCSTINLPYFRLNKLITKAVLDLLIMCSIKIRNIDRRQIKTNSYTDKAQEIQPKLVGASCYL